MSRLRVACIGTGFIAGKHLDALSGFDDVEIVAVADTAADRADAIAAAYGVRAYGDGVELLAQEELDAVWICVPPFAHGPLEEAAVDRGLPFFVEKPLAHDLQTAVGIAGRVADIGLLTAVGYHWRYLELVEQAAAALADAPPRLLTGYWLDKTPPVPWWVHRERSGGQVLEQTTHIFDLVRHLVGEVEEVYAMEVAASPDPDVAQPAPLAMSVTLRLASGAVGSISSARMLHARHRVGLHLMADGCAVELTERALVDHELRVARATGERVERSAEDPIAAEDRAFLDAVAGTGDGVRSPYADALRSHALAWAADLSAREDRPVRPAELGLDD